MQNLILIILFTLTTNAQVPEKPKKSIKEKRDYAIEVQLGGSTLRILKTTTTYSIGGNIISEIEACNDSNCCYYNKSFKLHKNKNEYWYTDDRLVLRIFRTCNSMPSFKEFHEYKFDNKKRLIEEKEQTFNYETDTQKYEKGKWIPAKIGDSTLTEVSIHQYKYNLFDSVLEEKIIIERKFPNKKNVSWKILYQYDKNRNLIKTEHPGTITVSENRYYDDKNRLTKIKSNLTGENITTDIEYDGNGNISSIRNVINDKTITTKYQYDNDNLLISKESGGNKIQKITIKYFYNEFNDLTRKETSYDNKSPFIEEFEYTYY